MLPDLPWSRIHIDHGHFNGSTFLVIVDAFSSYPCIHRVASTSAKQTIAVLDEDFAHFGVPHAIAADNAFDSLELKQFLEERSAVLLCGAPYHPAEWNGRRDGSEFQTSFNEECRFNC